MIYIVSSMNEKDAIMKAITEKAGSNTPAEAVVFSIPTIDVIGIGE